MRDDYTPEETEYWNGRADERKEWEDKIKAKIEWLDKEGYFEFLSNRDILKCHNILASLLEKE